MRAGVVKVSDLLAGNILLARKYFETEIEKENETLRLRAMKQWPGAKVVVTRTPKGRCVVNVTQRYELDNFDALFSEPKK